jgi:uncharacterized protein YjbJ (UPF0337 family)
LAGQGRGPEIPRVTVRVVPDGEYHLSEGVVVVTTPGTTDKDGMTMSTADKASNKVQDLKGRVKETTGRATGNNDLETKGQADQVKAAVKDIGEKVKDAGNKVKRVVKP